MAKSADSISTKSSIISSKAASLKQTFKKGTKAVTRPFKKLKHSVSIRSATRSIPSRSSTPSDREAVGNNINSATDNESAHDGSAPKVQLTPEQELGASYFYLLCNAMIITYFRISQTNLALTHLFIFQTRRCLPVSRRSTLPCFHLCCPEVQGTWRCCPPLSGLEGQIIHGQPQAPRPPLLQRRCGQRSYCWQAGSQTQ